MKLKLYREYFLIGLCIITIIGFCFAEYLTTTKEFRYEVMILIAIVGLYFPNKKRSK